MPVHGNTLKHYQLGGFSAEFEHQILWEYVTYLQLSCIFASFVDKRKYQIRGFR